MAKTLETPEANNRRRAIALLRAGGYVVGHGPVSTIVYSPRQGSGHFYTVRRWVDGSTVTWTCDATCEHYARHGGYSQFNGGTDAYSTRGTPCAHILLAMLARLSVERRATLFALQADLGAAWQQAHDWLVAA